MVLPLFMSGCKKAHDETPLFQIQDSKPWPVSTACHTYKQILPQTQLPTAQCSDEWIKHIEEQKCENAKLPCNITCQIVRGMTHYLFPVGQFELSQQVWLRPNTIIEGSGDPNPGMQGNYLPRQKPNGDTNTFFIAKTQGCKPTVPHSPVVRSGDFPSGSVVKCVRKGFLMNTNTWVKRINLHGLTENGPHHVGGLNGGGAFELPGCVSPYNTGKAVGCEGADAYYVTGNGTAVHHVLIEDVRLNDLNDESHRHPVAVTGNCSVTVFWSAMTPDDSPHSDITVRRIYSGTTYRDGVNVHGNVQNFLGEDLHFEYLGDDAFPIWGAGSIGNTVADNITFRRVTAWYPDEFDSRFGNCVQLFGVKRATYDHLRCCGSGHWHPSWDHSDPDLYQGHAFVVWNGFHADFKDTQLVINDFVWQFSKNGTDRCLRDVANAIYGYNFYVSDWGQYVKGGSVLKPRVGECGLPQDVIHFPTKYIKLTKSNESIIANTTDGRSIYF